MHQENVRFGSGSFGSGTRHLAALARAPAVLVALARALPALSQNSVCIFRRLPLLYTLFFLTWFVCKEILLPLLHVKHLSHSKCISWPHATSL